MSLNDNGLPPDTKPQLPPVITIDAVAGGLAAVDHLLQSLPPDSGMAFLISLPAGDSDDVPPEKLLQRHTQMPVHRLRETARPEPDHVYLIPPGRRARVEGEHLFLEQPVADEARDEHAARHEFLIQLTDALRPLADATQIKITATRILGEAVGASRALYAELHADGNTFTIERDYHIPTVPSVAGVRQLDDFGPPAIAELRAGHTLAVENIQTQPGLSADARAAYTAIDIGAHVTVPLVKHGRLVALLSIHHPTARAWTALEIAMVTETAERTWAAVERARAEADRRETEKGYRQVLRNSPVVFALADDQLRYQWIVNPHRDFDPETVAGKRDDEIGSGPGIEALVALKRRVLERGEQERQEITFARSDGDRTYDITATPVPGENGGVRAVLTASLDITESRQAEQALRESEARYRTLFESMDEGFFRIQVIFDEHEQPIDLLYLDANPAATRMVGEDWTGRRLSEISPDFEQHWYESFGRVAQTREAARLEHYAAPLDAWYSFYIFPVGEPEEHQIANVFQDITERKRAEEALRRSAERRRFLLELNDALAPLNSAAAIEAAAARFVAGQMNVDRACYARYDPATESWTIRHDYAAAGLASLSGAFPWEALATLMYPVGDGALAVITDVAGDELLPQPERARLMSRQLGALIIVPVMKDGALRGIFLVACREPRGWTADDITTVREVAERVWTGVERARYEAELRESERNFRAMADSIPQLAWMADETGWLFWYNRRWYEYTGTTPAEMEGWGWQAVHHPDHVERVVEHITHSFATGERWEDTFPLRGRNGEYRWFLSRALPIRDEQGRLLRWFGTNTDITEQREAEQALRESEARLRLAQEAAGVGTFEWDIPANVDRWSPEIERLYGLPAGGFGGTYEAWAALVHPDDLPRAERDVQEALTTGKFASEWRAVRPDGSIIWVLARGWVEKDARGEPLRMIGANVDITSRIQAEQALRESEQRYRALAETLEEQVQEQTRQVQELATELTLAEQEERDRIGRILHDDLQQQLYAVQLQLALLQTFCEHDDKEGVKAQLSEVQQELKSAIDTTRQLNVDLSPAILHDEGLTEAIGWLVKQMAEQYRLQVTVEAADSFRIADKGLRVLLFQAVRELLFNVVKHAGRREAVVHLEREGDHLRLTVHDRGRGFDVAALTNEHHRGSGLTTIHHRLRLVGGELQIESARRGGTRVAVIAPLALDNAS